MKNKKQLITGFALLIGVLILINILSNSFHFRLDLTADKNYTLSKTTKTILKELKEPVTVTAYFTKDLPAELLHTRSEFQDLLIEYGNISNRKVVYEFIDPSENDDLEKKAIQAGVQPAVVNVREKDQMKQQKVFLGAVVQLGEKSEIIPMIQPGAAMEYALSSAIKKLSVANKPLIGLLQGHSEPSLAAIYQAYAALSVLYDVEPVYLNDSTYTLDKYKTIAIIAPKDTFPQSHLLQIDKYLTEGGNLYMALNHVEGNFQNASGYVVNTGLEKWLNKKGIAIDDNFVIDASCSNVMVQQQQQGFTMQSQIQFPYLPVLTKFGKHPVTEGIETVLMQFASTLSYTGDSSGKFEPLVFTSDKSGTQPVPVYFDINRKWSENDFLLKHLPVAASLTPNAGSKDGKLIVITDGDFAVNGESKQQEQQQQRQLQPDNINLMVNSIDWLSDDTGLINLRTKGVTSRMLDQIDDGKKTFLKYLNFFLPILLIIGYGIIRVNHNHKIRLKRMEANYV